MSFMLVIEDDEMLREELVELLNTWGVETLGARCGRDAVAIALARPIDCVLCDYKLRLESGLDVLHALHDIFRRSGQSPRCYLMTGHLEITNIADEDIASLTDGLLAKPIQACKLKAIAPCPDRGKDRP